MKIYEAEILDNLQEAIASKVTARCEFGLSIADSIAKALFNPGQPDLFYINECVLVSTNWNLNDDIFTRAETWLARNTPVNKQFNHMHNDSFVIGHITSAKPVDFSGNIVSDNTQVEDLPDFDISISSVIYKNFQNEEKAKIVAKLIEEIPQNKWCVSMECIFSDFDYGVITPENEQKIVARNDKSSFLTKHLRAYGGSGVYRGYKLGRVLKGIVFSGVGSVDRPGNPRSLIKSFSFNGATASVQIFSEKVMEKELKLETASASLVDVVTKAQYDELKNELAAAKAAASKASEKEMEDAKKAKCELETSLASVQKELESVKALSDERSEKIKALETDLASAQEALKAAKEKEEKMEEENKAKCRLNQLISVGVDSAKASELVSKFTSASDEMFNEVVALNTKAKTEEKTEDKKEATASDLDNVIVEKTIAQKSQDTEVATAAASWIGSLLKKENK